MATRSPTSSSISSSTEITTRERQLSPTASQASVIATGTPYDSLSIATTNTGFTNMTNRTANTSFSQQPYIGGNIPIIRPPNLEQQASTTNMSSVTTQPLHINVSAAQQQQSAASQYSGSSTTSSSGTSLSSPGTASLRQPQPQPQPQYQQTQFANQFAQQISTFTDSTLLIDYGVMEAYNVGLLSAHDITAEQGSSHFDVAKAMFRQADTNHDGSISRQEFVAWGQNATPNPASQSHSSYGNNFNQTNLFAGATPDVANILQQSGLGQTYGNYQ